MANLGREPKKNGGYALIDTEWLRGIVFGMNYMFRSLTAFAGGGQAGGTVIPAGQLVELQVVATGGDSFQLPQAIAGQLYNIVNSTANSANIFANPSTNRQTGVLDTINGNTNVTAYALAAGKSVMMFCPRNGVWFGNLSA